MRLELVAAFVGIRMLRGQCLGRRIGERERLVAEIAAWEQARNASGARINWMFDTQRARQKLRRSYPDIGNRS